MGDNNSGTGSNDPIPFSAPLNEKSAQGPGGSGSVIPVTIAAFIGALVGAAVGTQLG